MRANGIKGMGILVACTLAWGWGCAGTVKGGVEVDAVAKTLQAFAQGVEKRDVSQVSQVLHQESQQYAWMSKKLMKIPQGSYLALLKQGKLGGVHRDLKIHSVDVNGNLASVKATLSDKKMALEFYFHLMKLEGRWQIMSNLVKVVPRAS